MTSTSDGIWLLIYSVVLILLTVSWVYVPA
jgi:hypothetical protein